MVWESCKVSGDAVGNPVKVQMTGLQYAVIALGVITLSWATCEIAGAMKTANELKRQELEIQKQRLDLARRQYMLDSLQYIASQKQR